MINKTSKLICWFAEIISIMGKIFKILLILLIFATSIASADEFKLKSGEIKKGQLLDSDNQNIYIETSSGLVNIPKNDLLELPTGITAPSQKPALKPAWGKSTPIKPSEKMLSKQTGTQPKAITPSTTPKPAANSKSGSQKIYGMDLMKIQQEGAAAQLEEMKSKTSMIQTQLAFQEAAKNNNMQGLQNALQKNPLTRWAINASIEANAKANLHKIRSMAAMHEAEKDHLPSSIQDLISDDRLESDFKNTVNGYNYALNSKPKGYTIIATPADSSSGLTRFEMDSETGKIK